MGRFLRESRHRFEGPYTKYRNSSGESMVIIEQLTSFGLVLRLELVLLDDSVCSGLDSLQLLSAVAFDIFTVKSFSKW